MRISDWSSDVCSSDLDEVVVGVASLSSSPPANPVTCTSRKPTTAMTVATSARRTRRSEEHTSELQSLMRISYAVFCLKKKNTYSTVEDNRATSDNAAHRHETALQ